MAEIVFEYLRNNPFYAKPPQTKVWWMPIQNLQLWKAAMYVSLELPINLSLAYYKVRGNDRKFHTFQKIKDFQQKTMQNFMSFDHFTMNSWKYLSNRSDRAWNMMSN